MTSYRPNQPRGAKRRAQVREQFQKGWSLILDGQPFAVRGPGLPDEGRKYWKTRAELVTHLTKLGLIVTDDGWVEVPE